MKLLATAVAVPADATGCAVMTCRARASLVVTLLGRRRLAPCEWRSGNET